MSYKNILLFIIIILGIIILSLYISNNNQTIQNILDMQKNQQIPIKTIYRYIPRQDDNDDYNYVDTTKPAFPSRIFKSMFENASPWVYSLKNPDYTTLQKVNEFYVSQS
jgi:hypothetical protein